MANATLVIGWGPAVQGREQKALQVFSEAIQYYTRLQQQGQIDSFEPVALEPHGGDLNGFLLVGGDPISTREGVVPARDAIPLSALAPGAAGTATRTAGGSPAGIPTPLPEAE
jgi:hypothetical protein